MRLLDLYLDTQKEIYKYFGYEESWQVFPIDDSRNQFWRVDEVGREVEFADTKEELLEQRGNYYTNEVYHYYHLEKPVYRGKDYTMIVVDTNSDGNRFLQIFSNRKELPPGSSLHEG